MDKSCGLNQSSGLKKIFIKSTAYVDYRLIYYLETWNQSIIISILIVDLSKTLSVIW